VRSLLFKVPCRVVTLVLLVVCLQGLLVGPLDLSLAIQYALASCTLHANAFPSPVGLVSFLASLIVQVAVLSIPLPKAFV
jgi:hypothetical protein